VEIFRCFLLDVLYIILSGSSGSSFGIPVGRDAPARRDYFGWKNIDVSFWAFYILSSQGSFLDSHRPFGAPPSLPLSLRDIPLRTRGTRREAFGLETNPKAPFDFRGGCLPYGRRGEFDGGSPAGKILFGIPVPINLSRPLRTISHSFFRRFPRSPQQPHLCIVGADGLPSGERSAPTSSGLEFPSRNDKI